MLLSISLLSVAANVSVNRQVESVEVFANGNMAINTTDSLQQNCYENGKCAKVYVGENTMTDAGVARILSLALMAKARSSPIKITFDNFNSNCFVSAMQVL